VRDTGSSTHGTLSTQCGPSAAARLAAATSRIRFNDYVQQSCRWAECGLQRGHAAHLSAGLMAEVFGLNCSLKIYRNTAAVWVQRLRATNTANWSKPNHRVGVKRVAFLGHLARETLRASVQRRAIVDSEVCENVCCSLLHGVLT